MTKRHPSLIPLTHDHHHTLAQARVSRGHMPATQQVCGAWQTTS
jgi:hypothetical protein